MKGNKNIKTPDNCLKSYVERMTCPTQLYRCQVWESGGCELQFAVPSLCPAGPKGSGPWRLCWGTSMYLQNSYSIPFCKEHPSRQNKGSKEWLYPCVISGRSHHCRLPILKRENYTSQSDTEGQLGH